MNKEDDKIEKKDIKEPEDFTEDDLVMDTDGRMVIPAAKRIAADPQPHWKSKYDD